MKNYYCKLRLQATARRVMLTSLSFVVVLSMWGQKLSTGTQLFLNLQEEVKEERANGPKKAASTIPFTLREEVKRGLKTGVVEPEVIDGEEYVSSFIFLKNVNNLSELEALGVKVEARFKTYVTAKIPVSVIEKLNDVDNVVQVDVSRYVQPATDLGSVDSKVDLSWAGTSNGLCSDYTGKGVVVGVIDQGIDFQHIAFKDANGNYRIKAAYLPGASSGGSTVTINGTTLSGRQYTTTSQLSSLTYDVQAASHGTHTSTIAGGSAVTIDATHKYSGMAPESDLVLCGLSSLSTTYIANSLKYIKKYADDNNQPCVVNVSLGSQYGPHDGTGANNEAYNDFTENGTAKGRAIMVATANDGANNMYFHGSASSSTPKAVGLEFKLYSNIDGTYTYYYSSSYYSDYYIWPKAAGATLKFQPFVLDKQTNKIVYTASTTATPTSTSGTSVSLGSTYFKYNYGAGSVVFYRSTDSYSGKYCYEIQVRGQSTQSLSTTNSEGKYVSRYAVGVLVYGASTSATEFDCWAGTFSGYISEKDAGTYGSYTLEPGSDDCSISTGVTAVGVVGVGAHVTRNVVNTSGGVSYTNSGYTVGDIAPFSSYSTGVGPDGKVYPDITAPGAVIISGVNRYDTSSYPETTSSDDASEYMTIINASDGSRYGSMSGTSMATPMTTGIVALWLQANGDLTNNEIKEIMHKTATSDSFTTGTNGKRFGSYGKIDALAGLEYIAPCNKTRITASENAVSFSGYTGETYTKTVTVSGTNLEGAVTATLSDAKGVFSITPTSISKAVAESGTTLTITYAPATAGTHTGTITLSSSKAEDVTITLNGVAEGPSLTASATALTLSGYVGDSQSETLTVTGAHLEGDVTVALSDASGMFSVDKTTITKSAATSGATLTVTYLPTSAGTHTGTITLSSSNAEDVTITLNGTAEAKIPTLSVSETTLNFVAGVDDPVVKTFTVSGVFISEDVAVTLSDANKVFAVSPAVIAADALADGGSATVTVTFNSSADGTFAGEISLSSAGATTKVVTLEGTANDGGTAADKYLNIAKYATIDQVGWRTGNIDILYKYTEYEDENVGWLSLSPYGIMTSIIGGYSYNWASYSGQKYYVKTTWDATDVFAGSDYYFPNTTARAFGRLNSTNTNAENEKIHITNCTEIRAIVKNYTGASTRYPTTLKVYKCTENADGSLTVSSTATSTKTFTTESSTTTLEVTGLDASTIYQVELNTTRGYFLEIAFKTPLPEVPELDMATIVSDVTVTNKKYKVTDDNLTAIYLSEDGKTLYCKDDNGYANPYVKGEGEIDYVELSQLMNRDYDQSNWVALTLPESSESEFTYKLIGSKLTGVKGTLINKVNPTIMLSDLPSADAGSEVSDYPSNLNVFVACSFGQAEQTAENGNQYWFMTPKPMEVAKITFAMWNSDAQQFEVPTSTGTSNADNLSGAFYVDDSKYAGTMPSLENGGVYEFVGLISTETLTASSLNKRKVAASSTYVVYPLDALTMIGKIDGGTITAIDEVNASGKDIDNILYHDLSGRTSSEPFAGVNIIEIRYSDGTRKVEKRVITD